LKDKGSSIVSRQPAIAGCWSKLVLTLAATTMGIMNMFAYIKTWASLSTDRRAVTALEYALIAGVIVAVIVVGFGVLASDISGKFNSIGNAL
jgi:Flp pilus assembly pilin Flp